MRVFLNILYQLLIITQIWVAICFTSLVYFYHLILGINDIVLLIISFFSVIAAYNSAVFAYNTQHIWRIPFILFSILICVFLAILHLNSLSLLLFISLGILSFLYAIPYTQFKFREIPQAKLFLIAWVWASSIVLIPNAQYDLWALSVSFHFIGLFLFVAAITIPFDIRDLIYDKLKLMTIPQRIGVKKAKKLSYIFIGLASLLFIISEYKNFNIIDLSLQLSFLIAFIFIRNTYPNKSKWFVAFWVESISLLPLIIYLILHCILTNFAQSI